MQSRGEGERQGPGPDDGASSGDQTSNDECGESEVDEPDREVSDGEGSAEEGGSGGSLSSPIESSLASEDEDQWWVQDGMLWIEHWRPRRFAMRPCGTGALTSRRSSGGRGSLCSTELLSHEMKRMPGRSWMIGGRKENAKDLCSGG